MTVPSTPPAGRSRRQLPRTGCSGRIGSEPSGPAAGQPEAAEPGPRAAGPRRSPAAAGPSAAESVAAEPPRKLRCRSCLEPVARRCSPARRPSWARRFVQARSASETHSSSRAQVSEPWRPRRSPASATAPASLRAAPLPARRLARPPPSRPARKKVPERDLPALAPAVAAQALPARRPEPPMPAAGRARAWLRSPARPAEEAWWPAEEASRPPSGSPARSTAAAQLTPEETAPGFASPSGRDTRARRRHAIPRAPAAATRWTHRRPAALGFPARAEPSCSRATCAPEAIRPARGAVPAVHSARRSPSPRAPRRRAARACARNAGSTGRYPC